MPSFPLSCMPPRVQLVPAQPGGAGPEPGAAARARRVGPARAGAAAAGPAPARLQPVDGAPPAARVHLAREGTVSGARGAREERGLGL